MILKCHQQTSLSLKKKKKAMLKGDVLAYMELETFFVVA